MNLQYLNPTVTSKTHTELARIRLHTISGCLKPTPKSRLNIGNTLASAFPAKQWLFAAARHLWKKKSQPGSASRPTHTF